MWSPSAHEQEAPTPPQLSSRRRRHTRRRYRHQALPQASALRLRSCRKTSTTQVFVAFGTLAASALAMAESYYPSCSTPFSASRRTLRRCKCFVKSDFRGNRGKYQSEEGGVGSNRGEALGFGETGAVSVPEGQTIIARRFNAGFEVREG